MKNKIIMLTVLFTLASCGDNPSYFAKKVDTGALEAPAVDPADAPGADPGAGPGNSPAGPGGKDKCPPKIGSESLKKDPSLLDKIACAKRPQEERYIVCHKTKESDHDDDHDDDDHEGKIVGLLLPQSGALGHLSPGAGDHNDFLLDCSKINDADLKKKNILTDLCHCGTKKGHDDDDHDDDKCDDDDKHDDKDKD